jgi:plastocyanin
LHRRTGKILMPLSNFFRAARSARRAGLTLAVLLMALPATGGTIEGRITYQGEVPKYPFADELNHRAELFTVHRQNRGLQFAVVYLRGKLPVREPPKLAPVVVDQKDHTFLPPVVAVRDGQGVRFTNSDYANHNVRSWALEPDNTINIYTGTGGAYEHRFQANRAYRPIRLGCDIHGWMRGWIYVFDHPWFAVTDSSGRFTISDAPDGTYDLEIRQPDGGLKSARSIEVKPGARVQVNVEFKATDLPASTR